MRFRVEELQRLSARRRGMGGGGAGSRDPGGDKKKGRQQRAADFRGWEGDELAHRLVLQTLENYARSLRVRRGLRVQANVHFLRDLILHGFAGFLLLFFLVSLPRARVPCCSHHKPVSALMC